MNNVPTPQEDLDTLIQNGVVVKFPISRELTEEELNNDALDNINGVPVCTSVLHTHLLQEKLELLLDSSFRTKVIGVLRAQVEEITAKEDKHFADQSWVVV